MNHVPEHNSGLVTASNFIVTGTKVDLNMLSEQGWSITSHPDRHPMELTVERINNDGREWMVVIPIVDPPHDNNPDRESDESYPYAGTSGHAGSSTSEDRAVTADESGTTRDRQAFVTNLLRMQHRQGLTVAELRDITDWHHGTASGVLSVLHKDGRIARLSEARSRCKVYVLPRFVDGRDTEAHGRSGKVSVDRAALEELQAALATADPVDVRAIVAAAHALVERSAGRVPVDTGSFR